MPTTVETVAFERGIQPLLEIVLPQRTSAVLQYRADSALQARIEDLASKSTEGQLTPAEKREYAGYVRANKFVAILKRHARKVAAAA